MSTPATDRLFPLGSENPRTRTTAEVVKEAMVRFARSAAVKYSRMAEDTPPGFRQIDYRELAEAFAVEANTREAAP